MDLGCTWFVVNHSMSMSPPASQGSSNIILNDEGLNGCVWNRYPYWMQLWAYQTLLIHQQVYAGGGKVCMELGWTCIIANPYMSQAC